MFHRLTTDQTLCFGATSGEDHLAPLKQRLLEARTQPPQVVVLDFNGIEAANASYLKATALWLLRCGMLHVEMEEEGRTPFAPLASFLPLNVYPLVANLSDEVAEELITLLRSERLPCLLATAWEGEVILKARCLGPLDNALQETLGALARERTSTATVLCEKYPQRPPIKPTAWSNRLAELYRLRLSRRERAGRQWLYSSISEEVCLG